MININELYPVSFDVKLKDIKINSKEINKGDLFVCTKGVKEDRHDYIEEAIEKGAAALIVSKGDNYRIPYVKVEDPNHELASLAKKFYRYQDSLKLIGTTGTDGKTTTASIIRALLGNTHCAYIGTNGIKGKKINDSTKNTTPEIHLLYNYFSKFEKEKLSYVSMEVSSEALYRNRVHTLNFDVGIMTNITEDHLNIHKTIENYVASKARLFELIKKDGFAILNKDDKNYETIKSKCHCRIISYGYHETADFRIKEVYEKGKSNHIHFIHQNKEYHITTNMLGTYNAYNLLAAIITATCFGYSIEEMIQKAKKLPLTEGRTEFMEFGQNYDIVLDYAHTANALRTVLTYLNQKKKNRIITVTGSAGGREHEKRKEMGKVVQELSDEVIYTMDDPRNENVLDIIEELKDKSKNNYQIIENREEAINEALKNAQENDIILIAGKGRDNYMAIGNEYIPYNDFNVIKNFFEK